LTFLSGNFYYIEIIVPNNLVTVFAAVIIGTDEKDEIKGMNKKMPYLVEVDESDKLGGRSASDYINEG
jgi:hypothetical protein